MSLGVGNLAYAEVRREGRDEVHYRVKAFGPDARALNMLIVNISPHGMMARCDTCFAIGDRIRMTLPVVGVVAGEVRWSLGGRIGCQFDHAIDLAGYYELAAVMLKGK
ncbi:MAG: PilZ domain-containing protein [Pseudomonadota bacterium]